MNAPASSARSTASMNESGSSATDSSSRGIVCDGTGRNPYPPAERGVGLRISAISRLRSIARGVAGCTGLEPVASGVTGRRYNQLN